MRKTIFSLFLLALCTLTAHADDRSMFGLKGAVTGSSVSTSAPGSSGVSYCDFDASGKLTSLKLESTNVSGYYFGSDFKRTATSIVGEDYTATISNGKVRKVSFTEYGNRKWTVTYSYNEKGLLSKITSSCSWTTTSTEHINATAAMNEAVKRANQLLAQLKKLKSGTPEYNKKQQEYNAAAKKASINATGSNTKTKTQVHTEAGDTKEYSDYTFDAHGNWESRKVVVNGSTSYKEYQKVKYTPEFLCAYQWPLLEKEGDLDKIETFYNYSDVPQAYKDKAQAYWNAHVKEYVATNYKDNMVMMQKYASRNICQPEVREDFLQECERLLNVKREEVYRSEVLPERNFKRLRQLAVRKEGSMAIFNKEYTDKILVRADSLFLQDVAALQEEVTKKYEEKDFLSAITLSTQGKELVADADNYTSAVTPQAQTYGTKFQQLLADATEGLRLQRADEAYAALMEKKANKSVKLADYDAFLENHPNTKYIDEVTALRKKRDICDHRGKFFHMGIAAEYAAGKGMHEITGGLGIRLGWHCSIVNFYTGVQYGGFMGMGSVLNGIKDKVVEGVPSSSEESKDVPKDGGYFSGQHFVVPVMVRLNFSHKYTSSAYIGVGANLNLASRGHLGRVTFENPSADNDFTEPTPVAFDHIDDGDLGEYAEGKSLYKKSFFITPRVSLGYSGKKSEFELYGLYELGDVVNKDLVQTLMNEYPTPGTFDKKLLDKQMSHKFRIGVTWRLLF